MVDKAEKLKQILELLKEDTVSSKQFLELMAKVMAIVREAVDTTKETTAQHRQMLAEALDKLEQKHQEMCSSLYDDAEERVDLLTDQVMKVLANVKDGKDGQDGIDGRDGRDGRDGKDGKDAKLDLNELVTQVLAKLPRTEIANRPIVGFGRTPRVHYYDLSDQCDGNTKTFKVPLNFGVIGVFSTQAPVIYRPQIDWTEGNRTLTLTAEVGAPQTGQTLWCQYLK